MNIKVKTFDYFLWQRVSEVWYHQLVVSQHFLGNTCSTMAIDGKVVVTSSERLHFWSGTRGSRVRTEELSDTLSAATFLRSRKLGPHLAKTLL